MTTAQDIINGALKNLGVITMSESPTADESNDALAVLNNMLDSWSLDNLIITNRTKESFSLTPSTASYTIGSSGTFNTVRPLYIAAAYITSGSTDYEMEITNDVEYAKIQSKASASDLPYLLSYDNAFPLGTIKLYPTPSAANSLTLISEKAITQLAAVTTTFSMAPGWAQALKTNLALQLATGYEVQPSNDLITHAVKAKAALERQVLRQRPIIFDEGASYKRNIYTG